MVHVMGCVFPVRAGRQERFAEQARDARSFFRDQGAAAAVDALGDDVPHGTVTDFHRAVAAEAGETIGFGWVEWPDAATAKAAEPAMESDPRMDMSDAAFDGRRMIFDGRVFI